VQDQKRYNTGAIVLHWLIAFALAVELAVGFGMPRDASGFAAFQFHKSLGLTILLLTLARIGWRLAYKAPPALDTGLMALAAKLGHLGLYAFMLLAPLTGWAIVSTSEIEVPTMLWGVIPWPHLPLDKAMSHTFEEVHEIIAFAGIALFLGHVLAALWHHFARRDTTLVRISPKGSAGIGLALLAGVVAAHFAVVNSMPGHEEGEHEQGEAAGATDAPSTAESAEATPVVEASDAAVPEDAATPAAEETAVATAEAPSWTIAPGGNLTFAVDNGGSGINGSFRRWDGSIKMDPENPEGANIAIRIDLASATLGDASQDEMLAGGDFFNVSANPTATFRSTNVEKTGANAYRARGTLSLRGASRPQTITFTLSGTGAQRQVSGSGTVDRNAFGVGVGESAADLGGDVRVEFNFSARS
jgi:cytochrome b561/polyisoprenoid-binding protein YceI